MATHEERVASNQAMYRIANERMRAWPERQDTGSAEGGMYFCECADNRCREQVSLAPEEYEAVRADSRRFVIAPGHVYPEAERVVEEHGDYAVVEKFEKVAHVVNPPTLGRSRVRRSLVCLASAHSRLPGRVTARSGARAGRSASALRFSNGLES